MLDLINENIYQNDELKHWGVLGMHWGVRRYQNPDGSLTPEGREHYGVGTAKETQKLSYSMEYEVLKGKKNKTKEEEERFAILDLGKNYFEKCYVNENYEKKMNEAMGEAAFRKYQNAGAEYLNSTNYGKHSTNAAVALGIAGAIGGAALSIPLNQFLASTGGFIMPFIGMSTGYMGFGLGIIGGQKINQIFEKSKLDKEVEANRKERLSDEALEKSINSIKKMREELTDYLNKNVVPLCIAYDYDNNIAAVSKENQDAYRKAMKEYEKYSKLLAKKYRKELESVGYYA